MSSDQAPATRQHAYTGPELPQLAEPTYAERVRTLLAGASMGTLSTSSRKHEGYPFGSLMPYALDRQGRPLFLISNMAMHTHNLKAEPRCSLFVTEANSDSEPLGMARATLVGRAEAAPGEALPEVREAYLARHPGSSYWVDFNDFHFFRLEPLDIYYVGGFGVMGWVEAGQYARSLPDPLAGAAAGILTHMNADHVDSMLLLARKHAQIAASGAVMTSVDRLGFTLRLKTQGGEQAARINYLQEVHSAQEVRAMLVTMVQDARESR